MVGHERPLLPPRELVGRSAPAEKRKGACWGWVEEGVWVLTKASNQAGNGRRWGRGVQGRRRPWRAAVLRRRRQVGSAGGEASSVAARHRCGAPWGGTGECGGIEERRPEMVGIEDRECSARLGAMRKKGGESIRALGRG